VEYCGAALTVDVMPATSGTARWVGDRVRVDAPSTYLAGLCMRPRPCPEHAGMLVVHVPPASTSTVCPCGGI
jgi:hypothetical protein